MKKLQFKEDYINNVDVLQKLEKNRSFIIIPDSINLYAGLSLYDIIIYGTIYQYAKIHAINKKESLVGKTTNISNAVIAQRANCSLTTVKRSIATLEDLDIISIKKKHRTQRTITIERDFLEPQPEEIELLKKAKEGWYGEVLNEINNKDNDEYDFLDD